MNARGFVARSTLMREVMTLVPEGDAIATTGTAHQLGKRKTRSDADGAGSSDLVS